jgi:short coiled-coil protein
MSSSSGNTTSAYPMAPSSSTPASHPPLTTASSSSSGSATASETDDAPTPASPKAPRPSRPSPGERQKSGPIIIPKTLPTTQPPDSVTYPADDARAMSPRRASADIEQLGDAARRTLKAQAAALQSSLAALAERIEDVKGDHDKLESENRFLQDYIGGLTRGISAAKGADWGGASASAKAKVKAKR